MDEHHVRIAKIHQPARITSVNTHQRLQRSRKPKGQVQGACKNDSFSIKKLGLCNWSVSLCLDKAGWVTDNGPRKALRRRWHECIDVVWVPTMYHNSHHLFSYQLNSGREYWQWTANRATYENKHERNTIRESTTQTKKYRIVFTRDLYNRNLPASNLFTYTTLLASVAFFIVACLCSKTAHEKETSRFSPWRLLRGGSKAPDTKGTRYIFLERRRPTGSHVLLLSLDQKSCKLS